MRRSSLTWNQTVSLVYLMDFFWDICNHLDLISQRTSVWLLYAPREWVHLFAGFMFRARKSMVLASTLALLCTRYVWSFAVLINVLFFISICLIYWKHISDAFGDRCALYLLLLMLFHCVGCWWKGNWCCSSMVSCAWLPLHVCYYFRTGVQERYLWRARWSYWPVHGASNNCTASM